MYQRSQQHQINCKKAAILGLMAQRGMLEKRKQDYYANPKTCLTCGAAIPYEKKRESRFCQKSCSATFNNKARGPHSPETREKISSTTKRTIANLVFTQRKQKAKLVEKQCLACAVSFEVKKANKTRIFCSTTCRGHFQKTNPEALEKSRSQGRINVQRQMDQGQWKGWSGKGKNKETFPEQFVRQLLQEHSLGDFEAQKQVARFAIDFAFTSKMIALEVDGKQHEDPKQKEHDNNRDKFLSDQGWTVFRLKWKSVKTPSGRKAVITQFLAFMALLEN